MVLREIQLLLYLTKDEEIIDDKKKQREILGNSWSKKKYSYPRYDGFVGIERSIGELLKIF
jgi:hypothetical protein